MGQTKIEYKAPGGFRYTKDHEWVQRKQNGNALIGITDYAAKMLHDIVYVSLPQVGQSFEAKQVFGQVESVKTVSDIYMPVSGKVVSTNLRLTKEPEVVGSSPYSEGWMLEVKPSSYEKDVASLLDSNEYLDFINELGEAES